MKPKLLASLSLAACLPLATAQTSTTTHRPAVHRAPVHAATGGCVPTPALSPKIPALPAGTGCVKPLYTLTRKPDVTLDYVSPLVSPVLVKELTPEPLSVSLLYVDEKAGTGELVHPGKWYTVQYTGYLTDGSKFDSSLDHGKPFSFPYGGHRVIAGWDTGLEGMRIGGKRRLFVPFQLAYGDSQRPGIPARSNLIFDIEVLAQHDSDPDAKPAMPPATGRTTPAPEAKPTPSPAGAAATPPVNSSTPASSTQPATKPETK